MSFRGVFPLDLISKQWKNPQIIQTSADESPRYRAEVIASLLNVLLKWELEEGQCHPDPGALPWKERQGTHRHTVCWIWIHSLLASTIPNVAGIRQFCSWGLQATPAVQLHPLLKGNQHIFQKFHFQFSMFLSSRPFWSDSRGIGECTFCFRGREVYFLKKSCVAKDVFQFSVSYTQYFTMENMS